MLKFQIIEYKFLTLLKIVGLQPLLYFILFLFKFFFIVTVFQILPRNISIIPPPPGKNHKPLLIRMIVMYNLSRFRIKIKIST